MRQYLLPRSGNFYKVNMHNHTTFSDGKQTPEEIKELYLSRGYSAVVFTEHEGLIDFSYLPMNTALTAMTTQHTPSIPASLSFIIIWRSFT